MWKIFITITISLIIIISIHHLWNYIKDTYSERKTKDLVGFQTQKYKSILNELIENGREQAKTQEKEQILTENDLMNMDDELTKYLEEELSPNF
jgi:uncharacterized protein YpmS